MDLQLSGSRVLVTGGTRGIGRATVETFVSEGAAVAFCARTAVEGAMTTTLVVDLVKGAAPAWPRLEDDDHWLAVGSSRPLEDAWRIAQVEMVRWFGELYGLHPMDAYQLLSQLVEVPVSNVVDANYSVTVSAAKAPLPAADAFGGLHRDLRARAATLR